MTFFREVRCSTDNDPFKFCADPDNDMYPGILADFCHLDGGLRSPECFKH